MSQSIQNIFKMMLKSSNSFLFINKSRRSSLRQNWPFAILLQAGACFTDQLQLAICDFAIIHLRSHEWPRVWCLKDAKIYSKWYWNQQIHYYFFKSRTATSRMTKPVEINPFQVQSASWSLTFFFLRGFDVSKYPKYLQNDAEIIKFISFY